jgi:hypothetical protein
MFVDAHKWFLFAKIKFRNQIGSNFPKLCQTTPSCAKTSNFDMGIMPTKNISMKRDTRKNFGFLIPKFMRNLPNLLMPLKTQTKIIFRCCSEILIHNPCRIWIPRHSGSSSATRRPTHTRSCVATLDLVWWNQPLSMWPSFDQSDPIRQSLIPYGIQLCSLCVAPTWAVQIFSRV